MTARDRRDRGPASGGRKRTGANRPAGAQQPGAPQGRRGSPHRRAETAEGSPPAVTKPAPAEERIELRGELLSGWHCVREALRAGRRPLYGLLLAPGVEAAPRVELIELADARSVPVVEVSKGALRMLPEGERAYGVGLDAGALPGVPLADLAGHGDAGQRLLVALDGIEDPQNLGAIARVVDAAGAGGLILTERRAAPASSAASRASAGAIEHLPIARIGNLRQGLERLKEMGFWTLGLDSGLGIDLFGLPDPVVRGDLVVVLGAEGRGLRPGLAPVLDHRVRIPMQGHVGSLNVATAAAVALFELCRRRARPGAPVGSP